MYLSYGNNTAFGAESVWRTFYYLRVTGKVKVELCFPKRYGKVVTSGILFECDRI